MQVFSPGTVLALKLGALGALAVIVASLFLWRRYIELQPAIGDPVAQVVPFSHKHHAGDDGIACRYCHSSVGRAAFAGIPPLSTCMTCHSQLYTHQPVLEPLLAAFRSGVPLHWKRLYKLPDFVYFNHGIHIAKGVGCASCHGDVDKMPLTARVRSLTMQWCLRCHRDPARYLRPRDEVFNLHWHAQDQLALGAKLVRKYHIDTSRMTDCSLCHR